MSHCPSCGRYVGPYETCPYCGARLTGRLSIRVVKIVAVLLTTVGLFLLWLAATHAEIPLITIGQAGATMNMAYVRLEGHCTRPPTYDPESDYLSFWIEDDTGAIRVSAYRAETRRIIAAGRVPALGDLVDVAGTLRVREDFLALTINVPEQLHITRAAPEERAIGDLVPEDQYRRVRVRGEIREIYRPYEGLTLVTIRDGSGSVPIALSDDLLALSGISGTLPFTTGQTVEVEAAVSLYDETPQLVPASVADIIPLAQPLVVAAPVHLGDLSPADEGRLVFVRGRVSDLDPFSAGLKFTLDDGSGEITVLLWQSLYEELPQRDALDIGAEVEVQGEISVYRGRLELLPELPSDVRILSPGAAPVETTVAALTPDDIGAVVTLRGILGSPQTFSAGVKYPLDDGSGQIILLLWSDVLRDAPPYLGAGARVVVTGQVSEYQGALEIVPSRGADVELVEPAALPPEEPTPPAPENVPVPIGDLTAADVGQTLTLSGRLGEREDFSKGVKFPLSDGSGSIVLLLWQNVYDALPAADRLTAGAVVTVTGRIEEYRGTLEIIPAADGVQVAGGSR